MISLVSSAELEAFAAERTPRQDDGIDRLRPLIEAWLNDFSNKSLRNVVTQEAGRVWMEAYAPYAGDTPPEGSLGRFLESVGESLTKTSEPENPPSDAQIERIAVWLSVSAINSGFSAGYGAVGGVRVRWMTMGDEAVRSTHREVDGTVAPLGGTFNVGGFDLLYPGDPVGPPSVWINCRCILAPAGRLERANMTAAVFENIEDPDELLPDEVDIDDEDLVDDMPDEIPVHGVATIEGKPTGDGRMFKTGSLTNRPLPLPLRYEFVGTHGGDTSNVAVVGRIDEMWLEGDEYRYRGVIIPSKAWALEAIEGIIDGSLTGVSVEVDAVVVDVEHAEAKEANLEAALEDRSLYDVALQQLDIYSEARVCGFTMVPIPAYMEAFIALGHDFKDELTDEDMDALAACGCAEGSFREVDEDERERLAEEGKAMPDGSYPIANIDDLKNAIQAIGRADDPDAVKAHIKRRASELGAEELIPADWKTMAEALSNATMHFYDPDGNEVSEEEWMNSTAYRAGVESFAPGTKDGPGWVTHPRATARIRRYWVRGKGAAKIKWGVPGDFNRCRRQLAKYVQNPEWLAGLCANMHKEAIGMWPGQEGPGGRHSLLASGAAPVSLFSMTAAASPAVAPAAWFENPNLSGPTPLQVDLETGRVFGHLATWNVCHIGIPGVCTTAPRNYSNYAYFRTGVIRTEEGTDVAVGHITIATGHAPIKASAQAAASHYDNTGSVVVDVAAGDDPHGIWVAGALRSGVDLEQATTLRAASLSGDWRTIGGKLELVGALAVNVPGFPIPRTSLAASAERQESLVAAGIVVQDGELVAAGSTLTADEIAAITRNAIAEYRHQERREVRLAAVRPVREQVRAERIAAVRAASEGE